MSRNPIDPVQAAETATQETGTIIRQVRTAARLKYTPEEKIRIVLEGFRREVTICGDLCRLRYNAALRGISHLTGRSIPQYGQNASFTVDSTNQR